MARPAIPQPDDIEVTEEMLEAGYDAYLDGHPDYDLIATLGWVYRAMHAARLAQEAEEQPPKVGPTTR